MAIGFRGTGYRRVEATTSHPADPRDRSADDKHTWGLAGWVDAATAVSPLLNLPLLNLTGDLVLCQNSKMGLNRGWEKGSGLGKGVRHQKPERPFGCFALLVSDPFSRPPKIQGLAKH